MTGFVKIKILVLYFSYVLKSNQMSCPHEIVSSDEPIVVIVV